VPGLFHLAWFLLVGLGLNSGLWACKAGTLPLKPHLQFNLAWFLIVGLRRCKAVENEVGWAGFHLHRWSPSPQQHQFCFLELRLAPLTDTSPPGCYPRVSPPPWLSPFPFADEEGWLTNASLALTVLHSHFPLLCAGSALLSAVVSHFLELHIFPSYEEKTNVPIFILTGIPYTYQHAFISGLLLWLSPVARGPAAICYVKNIKKTSLLPMLKHSIQL
jgi:hypothetical protein